MSLCTCHIFCGERQNCCRERPECFPGTSPTTQGSLSNFWRRPEGSNPQQFPVVIPVFKAGSGPLHRRPPYSLCTGRASNPQVLSHTPLKRARIPIPARPHCDQRETRTLTSFRTLRPERSASTNSAIRP